MLPTPYSSNYTFGSFGSRGVLRACRNEAQGILRARWGEAVQGILRARRKKNDQDEAYSILRARWGKDEA